MMPHRLWNGLRWNRREALGMGLGLSLLSGCSSPLIRGQSPDVDELVDDEVEDRVRLVRDMANSYGMFGLKIEGIGLVTQLSGTGSNPPDDHRRRALIDEMQSHNVDSPHKLLASPNTSLVLVYTVLPPAVQKGERIDVQVRVPTNSQTTSLSGGWLMSVRLREMEVLGGSIRTGRVAGLAEGYVIVESAFKDGSPNVLNTRGVILGTAVSHMNRSVGLSIVEEYQSVEAAAAIGSAINSRFQVTEHGRTAGIATPKRDNFVELTLPRTYKGNVERFMSVVRNVAIKESAPDRLNRMRVLETKLLEPTTTAQASIQLEAIGREAIPSLKRGLESSDLEVRFNAAEALAYLGVSDGAKALGEAARSQAAFRWGALHALALLDELTDARASDVLTELLDVPSAETRYGAFRALRTRNPLDPHVKGEVLGDSRFSFHVVSTIGEPMVHFSLAQRPEMVVFGTDVRLTPPPFLSINQYIMLKRVDANRVKVSRFKPGEEDLHHECSSLLSELIPVLVQAGASYQEVMLALRTAKKEGFLEARVAIDAVPRPKRAYYRSEDSSESQSTEDASRRIEYTPAPADEFDEQPQVAPIDFNTEDKNRGFWSRTFGKLLPGS